MTRAICQFPDGCVAGATIGSTNEATIFVSIKIPFVRRIPAAILSHQPAAGHCAEVRGSRLASALFSILFGGMVALATWQPAEAHDIYTGVHGKNGFLCCGGNDCAATTYRESGGDFQFLTRENEWVTIPQSEITFLPIPGDPPSNDDHHSHLCYRPATQGDHDGPYSSRVFGNIYLYCAFIPPTYF